MKKIHFAALLLSTTLVLSSCWRIDNQANTDTSKNVTTAEGMFDDIQKLTEDATKEYASQAQMRLVYGDSLTVTIDPAWPDATYPKTITLDFGDGVIGLDGKTRSGLIVINATGPYRQFDSELVTTPVDYFVDGYEIEGVKTVMNRGQNEEGNMKFDLISVGEITSPNGEVTTWESDRNREWIEGEDTNWLTNGLDGILDDTYSITGVASGNAANGVSYSLNITDPLIVSLDCHWIKQGVLELSPSGLNTRTLNYGDGECDNQATLSVNGNTYDITLW